MKFDRRLTDEIYTSDTVRLGKDAFQAMQETIYHNGGVGTITGYYDAELSILSVSNLLLHNLNHSYESLMEQTKGSLKNLFYKKDATFLDNARFRQIQGGGEGRILTADGSPVYVRLYKEDAADTDGTPIWVLSVQMNWAYENLALVNESIHSALWYFECNENGEIVNVNWSHAFRQILGYHDILDFPNKLDSWSNLLHPEDHDRVMQLLLETIADKTNTTKYNVEYRLKMHDGQYQWFRASAEVIRRMDGSANRIAGIISNIDAEKRSRMQAQRAAAFHRAFTSANLCEYYVNLEKNTFDTFKVEPSLMTAFEQNHTWDGLVRFLVDNYVVEEDKQSVTDFYNRAYITEKLKVLETELRQECRIVLDGEERWVSNVVMRGEIEDSEYAMIFLRDITESKAETARRMQMASDNASMDLLIKSMVRLLDRFVVCDLENDRYRFYNLQGEMIYAPTGTYHDFVEQVAAKYKTLESLDTLDAIISPENIRRNLQSENDIYKFEYCSMDENTYKIASFIPLEWDGTKLVKALLGSMDVSQEKKAEIESHKALKDAYRAAENANCAKTEFLSRASVSNRLSSYLYKIEHDPKGHKRSFLKIIDGSLRLRDVVRINDSEKFIKIKNLKTINQGREINVDEVGANDIAIVEDMDDFRIGNYLGAEPCLIQGLSHQHPALKSSVRPDRPEERSKVISALNTLWIEDPSLSFSINSYSDELEISLYGLTQKEIIQTLLEERFSVKVHFDEIKTIYKERPVKKVNKIIQIEVPPNPYWATIGLTLEPLPLGAGLQIESDISYGYLNHSFQNAVFEGIRMSCQSGLHGWEVTDLKVTFTQAEYYSPVSTPADFRQLTPYVFRLALQQSGVDILEPMLCFELQIPQVASSKAITDLQKLMSEIEDISCNNEWCHIKGKVPLNTSKDYASEVSSYTKGLGIFMVKPCGYQITKGGYSDNIRMNEKDKLLFMFQKSMSSK